MSGQRQANPQGHSLWIYLERGIFLFLVLVCYDMNLFDFARLAWPWF